MNVPGWVRTVAVLGVVAVLAWIISRIDPTFVGTWFTRLGAPAQTVFICWYALLRPWRRPGPGRALFVKSLGMALLLDLILVAQITNRSYPGRAFISALTELLIFVGIYWQLIVFARSRWDAHHTGTEVAHVIYDSKGQR